MTERYKGEIALHSKVSGLSAVQSEENSWCKSAFPDSHEGSPGVLVGGGCAAGGQTGGDARRCDRQTDGWVQRP